MKNIKIKKWVKTNWLVLSIITLAIILRIIYTALPSKLWWDETIYIGIAKYIYSWGQLGIWELFRPVGLPLILGFFWKIGANIIVTGKILMIFFILGTLILTYLIAEKCYKKSGLYAVLILGSLPLFFKFSNVILSGTASLFFALLAVYLILKQKFYWAGLSAGISFMMRFPQGLVLAALGYPLLVYLIKHCNRKGFWLVIKQGLMILGGFLTTVLPYLIFNWHRYGNFLQPFISANQMMQTGAYLYDKGQWYYFGQLLIQNGLLILIIGFLTIYLMFKELRKKDSINLVLLISVLMVGYFTYLIHKEDRYIMIALPYLCILAGIFVQKTLLLIFSNSKKWRIRTSNAFIGLFIIITLIVAYFSAMLLVDYTSEELRYYTYFEDDKSDNILLASGPTFLLFTDKPIKFLASWEYAYSVYEQYQDEADYIAFNHCQYSCEPGDTQCEEKKEKFLDLLSELKVVLGEKIYGCEHKIYKLD